MSFTRPLALLVPGFRSIHCHASWYRDNTPSIDQAASTAARADWSIAIDGGFVRGVGRGELRNFEILTGRLASPHSKPYVFAWVGSQATGAAERVSILVRARTGSMSPKLSMVTDGANNTLSIRQAPGFEEVLGRIDYRPLNGICPATAPPNSLISVPHVVRRRHFSRLSSESESASWSAPGNAQAETTAGA